MQRTDFTAEELEEMEQFAKDLRAAILPDIPVEERLHGIPAEDRLRGIPAEKIVEALDDRELDRIRKLLQHPKGHGAAKKRKRK